MFYIFTYNNVFLKDSPFFSTLKGSQKLDFFSLVSEFVWDEVVGNKDITILEILYLWKQQILEQNNETNILCPRKELK